MLLVPSVYFHHYLMLNLISFLARKCAISRELPVLLNLMFPSLSLSFTPKIIQ